MLAELRPGRQLKSGSSDSATFMRKVPEPQRQSSHALAKSAGSAARSMSSRYSSFGFRLETTAARARCVSPVLGDHADGAALLDEHLAHRASTADSTPCARGGLAIAW